ncbi:MAG: double-strand break repair helicase AddA [Bosea sp. (in: a-proteobacteria)]
MSARLPAASRQLNIPAHTLNDQELVSRPDRSAWVSANAGSGKTYVLVNRVLRLLLDGVQPSRILCLTYTKAAASNMSNRVFARLGEWSTFTDDQLKSALSDLGRTREGPGAVSAADMRRARTLFAQTLETPGGLRIETIHAFCMRVLQSAPFEANVPAGFSIADDAEAAEMMRQARHAILQQAADEPEGALAKALELIAADTTDGGFAELMDAALRDQALFLDDFEKPVETEAFGQTLAEFMGVSLATTEQLQGAFLADAGRLADVAHIISVCLQGLATDQKVAAKLLELKHAASHEQCFTMWRSVLLTQADRPSKRVVTQSVSDPHPEILTILSDLADRMAKAVDQLKSLAAVQRTVALTGIVSAVLRAYRKAKSDAGLLDYDDVITRTSSLLSRLESAWVLYRLDAGIDHVLVDEAQDTSRAQWRILERLTDEFGGGEGAVFNAIKPRTVFAVGDPKQSIYSFQGAEPGAFVEMARLFAARIETSGEAFEHKELKTSFRSAPDIVAAVDAIFAPQSSWPGVSFDGLPPEVHETALQQACGAVDIWPLEVQDKARDQTPWDAPVDAPERRAGVAQLSQRIASTIKSWLINGQDDLGQPVQAGDIMILVRSRNALSEAIIRALKMAHVPVVGRDRLQLSDHIAVEDMLVLGQAVQLPQDDLAFATLLKTPLFGLGDAYLERLAPEREGSLHAALVALAETDTTAANALALLQTFRTNATRMGPFAFYADLLGPRGGRKAAIARLGAEAGDALDVFLSAAQDFERREGPSLSLFLAKIAGAQTSIKRDLAADSNEVRVMTIHGAKGLEAPIVFLADIGLKPNKTKLGKLVQLGRSAGQNMPPLPVWSTNKEADAASIDAAKADAVDKQIEEHNRLLYVALTRAMNRLVICGIQSKGTAPAGSWYHMIEQGLAASETGLKDLTLPDGSTVRRFKVTDELPQAEKQSAVSTPATAIPEWALRAPPKAVEFQPPLSPSNALGAADARERPTDGPYLAEAAAAGRMAHMLLQLLPDVPPEQRAERAAILCAAKASSLSEAKRSELIAQVLDVLGSLHMSALFAPGSLAEVAIAGSITLASGETRQVQGQIDRLAVSATRVVLADYKTAARPPRSADQMPRSTVAQLAIYRDLVAQLYPGRTVEVQVIYTANMSVLAPLDVAMDAALAAIGQTDSAQSVTAA